MSKTTKTSNGVRYSIWLPADVLHGFRAAARERGVTVSSLIVSAAKRSLNRRRGK